VERSHYLLGRTVDSGRVWDLAATAAYLRARHGERSPVCFAGEGGAAVLAVYAALLEPEVGGLVLFEAPGSHMESTAPVLLNVLRVCDVPEAVGMLAPRSVRLLGPVQEWSQRTAALYRSAGAGDRFAVE
jgi:pimeloyl-ACP methyl ester carboxylesterase